MEWHIGVDSRRFPVVQLVLVSRETLQPVEIPQVQFCDVVFMPVVHSQAQFLDKVFMPVDSGTCLFTAPVTEPFVMSFTVPWIGYTIDATATVADCPGSAAPFCCEECLRRDVVWWWIFHS